MVAVNMVMFFMRDNLKSGPVFHCSSHTRLMLRACGLMGSVGTLNGVVTVEGNSITMALT
jgi:hypothetical protein